MFGYVRFQLTPKQRIVYDAAFYHARRLAINKVHDSVDPGQTAYEILTHTFLLQEVVDITARRKAVETDIFQPRAGKEMAFARLWGEYDGIHDARWRYHKVIKARLMRQYLPK